MNEFISIIHDLITLFEELIQIELTKLEAIKNNRITHLQDCMNREQAAIMKLRGLDKKRESCQEKLGYKGYKFQQILKELPDDDNGQLKEAFDKLTKQIRQFKKVNEGAQAMIEINIHALNKIINNSPNDTKTPKSKWEVRL